jgi:hypothetical protein
MGTNRHHVDDRALPLECTSPDLLRQFQKRDPRLRARREWAQEGELMQKERTGLAHIDA